MNEIEFKIASFLGRVQQAPVEVDEAIINEFAEACKHALRRQFMEPKRQAFTLRMSNVGKPLCQLQHEKAGTPGTTRGYAHIMQMLVGDMHEAAIIAVMRMAGIKVKAVQKKVSVKLNSGTMLDGTLDVIVTLADNRDYVFDVKSASPWSFKNKFVDFQTVAKNDAFGYVGQGRGYSAAEGIPFGGWIVSEKSTGEIKVIEAPEADPQPAIDAMSRTEQALKSDKIERCYEDEEEVFYKKKTGNRVLGSVCSMCEYKSACWPNLRSLPSIPSKASDPKIVDYTFIAPEHEAAA